MTTLHGRTAARRVPAARTLVRDGLIVSLGGQAQRAIGVVTALMLRGWLTPEHLGVYSALRIDLDQTNRSSLGIGLGAVQEIPKLRAAGRHDEARAVADAAHTATALLCVVYALGLLVWAVVRAPLVAGDPLAAEWTWGLAAVAGLTLLQRRLTFHVAVLRACGEFPLTTELDLFEAVAALVLFAAGLALAGFWGLIGAVGGVLGLKLAYLHARHPLRLRWRWEPGTAWRLMRTGLPIFAATAAYGVVTNLDRVLILWSWPGAEAARAAGLYSIAALGAGWGLDAAGRVATVLGTHFLETLGRGGDAGVVLRHAARVVEAQAPWLALGAAGAVAAGPSLVEWLLPRYVDGLPALRPLAPGMALLALSWPARQAMIAAGRPYRVAAAALGGAAVGGLAGAWGAAHHGLAGVAAGLSLGYAVVYALTSAAAFRAVLGGREFPRHQLRAVGPVAWMTASMMILDAVPLAGLFPRLALLAVLAAPLAVVARPGPRS